MNRRKSLAVMASLVGASLGFARPALANKSSVAIDAPKTAAPGSEITIKVRVSHDGNNLVHHTEWVFLSSNGKEFKRWEFTAFSLPEDGNFTLEIKYKVGDAGTVALEAKANCNLHGSAGPAKTTVTVK